MVIGITGKSGSGKSTYAEKLSKDNGYFVVHVDEIGHEVLERDDIQTLLINTFGSNSVDNGIVAEATSLGPCPSSIYNTTS